MSLRDLPAAELLRRLAAGWTSSHHGLADELIDRWRIHLGCRAEIREIGEDFVRFDTSLSNVWLRSVAEVPCLLVGGEVSAAAAKVAKFWNSVRGSASLPFVLTLSRNSYFDVLALTGHGFSVVFSPEDLAPILDGGETLAAVKRKIHEQVPRARLVPYNFTLPADETMFVGRHAELQSLKYQERTSFAIVGPSRIGKTSLVNQFRRQLVREGSPLARSTHYISFYECAAKSSDDMALWLAERLAWTSRSQKVTAASLGRFLKSLRSKFGEPLNLLLDEVDAICNLPGFHSLEKAAREEDCRLVLCGRGNLLRAMHDPNSYLVNRLALIRLKPLSEGEAKTLLFRPLEDLRIHIVDPDEVADLVLRLSGRLPHLLQFYGQKLVDRACDRMGTSVQLSADLLTVSPRDVHAVKSDMATASFYLSALREISGADPEAYLLALLLLREGMQRVAPAHVLRLANGEGLEIDYNRAVDICNHLVISNVLMWDEMGFCLANEGLIHHARCLGYLDTGVDVARRPLQSSRSSALRPM